MDTVRLIDDPAAAGSWNMAVDQVLLEGVNAAGSIVLRFYQWTPATLSLGYFQSARQRAAHLPSANCAMVRRVTGGGAILHDRELTYSVCIPRGHPLAVGPAELYMRMHEAAQAGLRAWGIETTLAAAGVAGEGKERFLCFERRSPGDLLLGRYKIGGSAQRRRDGAVLQHGSFLIGRSDFAPELPGICELTGVEISPSVWQLCIIDQLQRSLHWTFTPLQLSEREQLISRDIQNRQFDLQAWTFGR